jgi:hypothetical protein
MSVQSIINDAEHVYFNAFRLCNAASRRYSRAMERSCNSSMLQGGALLAFVHKRRGAERASSSTNYSFTFVLLLCCCLLSARTDIICPAWASSGHCPLLAFNACAFELHPLPTAASFFSGSGTGMRNSSGDVHDTAAAAASVAQGLCTVSSVHRTALMPTGLPYTAI